MAKVKDSWLVRHVWKNGACIAVQVSEKPLNDEPSDVIRLCISPASGRGSPSEHFLNIDDAAALIHCLSAAMCQAIVQGTPVGPEL